jgi:hypothetical protein
VVRLCPVAARRSADVERRLGHRLTARWLVDAIDDLQKKPITGPFECSISADPRANLWKKGLPVRGEFRTEEIAKWSDQRQDHTRIFRPSSSSRGSREPLEKGIGCTTIPARNLVMNRSPPPIIRSSRLFEEVEREKEASRAADERAIASGRKSVDQLERENGLFPGHLFRVDYKSAKRLW